MRPFENETELATALLEVRPAPSPEFAEHLDAHAAAGFPRDSRWAAAVARVRERLASTPPRKLIAPAGAFAIVAIVVATAVVATNGSEGPTTPTAQRPASVAPKRESNLLSAPSRLSESASAEGHAGTEGSAGTSYSATAPRSGPYASQAGRRDVERSAEIVLGAEPEDVRADTAKVFDAVHAADGIVLDSSIRDGAGSAAGAEFELLIPSAKLGDALASFSRIAEVRSRHEATADITAPTVSAGERLRDTRARIEGLLGQLADADTDAERTAIEAQLHSQRFRAAALRSRLSSLERRANFSRVSLRIETGSGSAGEGSGGGWGVGNGVDGAGRILAVAAGVTVIGLALFAPFVLIALLAWLACRAWVRKGRRDALSRT